MAIIKNQIPKITKVEKETINYPPDPKPYAPQVDYKKLTEELQITVNELLARVAELEANKTA